MKQIKQRKPYKQPTVVAWTRARLLRTLKRYRVPAARRAEEVDRIMRGPEVLAEPQGLTDEIYPFGWHKSQLPRLWRRIFHGGAVMRGVLIGETWATRPSGRPFSSFIWRTRKSVENDASTSVIIVEATPEPEADTASKMDIDAGSVGGTPKPGHAP